ncbi:NACHT domain-containing protein [Pseudaestuariivita sp.]|uniref:NACHT domain-containing protein n=1 Tax=Pseudaestuariivita sp. TaxID=2211669 RepID=UPI0040587347
MTGQVDPNQVAATIATDLIKDFFGGVASYTQDKFSDTLQRLFPKFEKHLIEVHRRVSHVKVLCSPDAPIDFRSVYVCPTLRLSEETIGDDEFLERVIDGGRIVVKSQGGAGKSFLVRHLWLSLFEKPRGVVPVFIELRGINSNSSVDLESYIRLTCVETGELSEANFAAFGAKGAFVFLLDGFDEVERRHRAELEAQLLSLAKKFPKCSLVVTGRPDERFASWTSFSIYSCEPFNYEQFCALIGNVPFDVGAVKRFLKLASEDFFKKNEDFLSNPLLALMMLMTYRENAEIPTSLAAFYENCYFTLFSRHDALKEQFNREKVLDQNEFRRLFSLFCLLGYLKSKQDFSEAEIYSLIERSIELSRISIGIPEALAEFCETVNLVYKDGLRYWFVHRSFQEYFSAYCCVAVLTERTSEILRVFAERHMDSCLQLASEMHPDLVFKEYFSPGLSLLEARFSKIENGQGEGFNALSTTKFVVMFDLSKGGSSTSLFWDEDADLRVFMAACRKVFGFNESGFIDCLLKMHNETLINASITPWPSKFPQRIRVSVSTSNQALIFSYEGATNGENPLVPTKAFDASVQKKLAPHIEELNKVLEKEHLEILQFIREIIKKSKEKSNILAEELGI